MTEALQQLVREFEEKMMVIFQQLVTESEDLKKEVRKLQSTGESQRAENDKLFAQNESQRAENDKLFAQNESQRAENDKLFAQNLKLKNGMLIASEKLKDFLQGIEEEATETAAGKEVAEV